MTPLQDAFNQQHDLTCSTGKALCVHFPALTCAVALLELTLSSQHSFLTQENRFFCGTGRGLSPCSDSCQPGHVALLVTKRGTVI